MQQEGVDANTMGARSREQEEVSGGLSFKDRLRRVVQGVGGTMMEDAEGGPHYSASGPRVVRNSVEKEEEDVDGDEAWADLEIIHHTAQLFQMVQDRSTAQINSLRLTIQDKEQEIVRLLQRLKEQEAREQLLLQENDELKNGLGFKCPSADKEIQVDIPSSGINNKRSIRRPDTSSIVDKNYSTIGVPAANGANWRKSKRRLGKTEESAPSHLYENLESRYGTKGTSKNWPPNTVSRRHFLDHDFLFALRDNLKDNIRFKRARLESEEIKVIESTVGLEDHQKEPISSSHRTLKKLPIALKDEGTWKDLTEADEESVEVPGWRITPVEPVKRGSTILMEDISEGAFLRRHARLELDEKRRKRWDSQRVREESYLERLKDRQKRREQQSVRRRGSSVGGRRFNTSTAALATSTVGDKFGKDRKPDHSDDEKDTEEKVTDNDNLLIRVSQELPPLSIFGYPMPLTQKSEFELPWCVNEDVLSSLDYEGDMDSTERTSVNDSLLRRSTTITGNGDRINRPMSPQSESRLNKSPPTDEDLGKKNQVQDNDNVNVTTSAESSIPPSTCTNEESAKNRIFSTVQKWFGHSHS